MLSLQVQREVDHNPFRRAGQPFQFVHVLKPFVPQGGGEQGNLALKQFQDQIVDIVKLLLTVQAVF